MAVSANTVWEIRTTGSSTNGGGFVAGATGIDRSQQNTAHVTTTTATAVHTTTTQIAVSAVDYTVSLDDVGNVIQVHGGTATAGFYEITAVDVPNNRWTLDAAVGTAGQTVVASLGGALTDFLAIWPVARNGNKIFVKAGTYNRTVTCPTPSFASYGVPPFRLVGYNTTRGDTPTGDNRPLIQLSTNANLTAINIDNGVVENFRVDCASLANSIGITGGNFQSIINCKVTNFTTFGINCNNGMAFFCEAGPGTGYGFGFGGSSSHVYCWGHDIAGTFSAGFLGSGTGVSFFGCVASDNTGANMDGFNVSGWGNKFINCLAIRNGRDGISIQHSGVNIANIVNNNILALNGQYGLNLGTGTHFNQQFDHNAYYNNTTGQRNGFTTTGANGVGLYTSTDITLTGDPFTDSANDDFSLNSVAGAGAACRGSGWPGSMFPGGFFTDHSDIGAAQHEDTGGGGGGSGEVSHTFIA